MKEPAAARPTRKKHQIENRNPSGAGRDSCDHPIDNPTYGREIAFQHNAGEEGSNHTSAGHYRDENQPVDFIAAHRGESIP